MKFLRSLVIAIGCVLGGALVAWAGSSTLNVIDGNSAHQNMAETTDGSGNFYPKNVLCDYSAAANCAGVTSGNALKIDGSATTQPASQSGTWTVQPGNTANTTPWLATINQGGNSASVSAGGALSTSQAPTQYLYSPGTNGFTTTPFTIFSTDLNTWGIGASVVSSVNGTSGKFSQSTTGNALFGRCWFANGTATTTPLAGANIALWFLTSTDGGTTFEQSTVLPPPRAPDIVIPLESGTALSSGLIFMSPPRQPLWAETVKIVAQNNSGVALTGTGQTIKCGPEATQH